MTCSLMWSKEDHQIFTFNHTWSTVDFSWIVSVVLTWTHTPVTDYKKVQEHNFYWQLSLDYSHCLACLWNSSIQRTCLLPVMPVLCAKGNYLQYLLWILWVEPNTLPYIELKYTWTCNYRTLEQRQAMHCLPSYKMVWMKSDVRC